MNNGFQISAVVWVACAILAALVYGANERAELKRLVRNAMIVSTFAVVFTYLAAHVLPRG